MARLWTDEETNLLRSMVSKGKFDHEIAAALYLKVGIQRSTSAVRRYRQKLKLDNGAAVKRRATVSFHNRQQNTAPIQIDYAGRPSWMTKEEWRTKEYARIKMELLRAENEARVKEAARRQTLSGNWMPGDPIE